MEASDQSPRPSDSFAKKSLAALQKEYFVIGKTSFSSFTSWTVIAFFIGVTVTAAFLASQSASLESSQAVGNLPLWEQITKGTKISQAIHVVSSSLMYAVGPGKRIYRWDGSQWTVLTKCCVRNSFAFINEQDIYAMNDRGLIMHWDGINWLPLGANNVLHAKSSIQYNWPGAGTPHKLYALGTDNRIWRWDGSSQYWNPVTDCCVKDDFAVVSDDAIYGISYKGDLILWSNNHWNKVSTGSKTIKDRIRFSQGIQTDLVYAIGKDKNIVRWGANSGGFAPITSGKNVNGDFYFYSENDIYTIAKDGNIWHWTGGVRPGVKVLSPNGGEIWGIGSNQIISWTSAGPTNNYVGLSLRRQSGLPVISNQTILPLGTYGSTGSAGVTVPTVLPANDYIIEAINYNYSTSTPPTTWTKDQSDASFSIVVDTSNKNNFNLSIPPEPTIIEVDDENSIDLAAISKNFYAQNPDAYDFLGIFFDFGEINDNQYHIQVKNTIKGTGTNQFDNTAYYGSKGNLLGIGVLGNANEYSEDRYAYNALTEELIAHYWGVYVGDLQDDRFSKLPVQNTIAPVHWTPCMSFPRKDTLQPYWKARQWKDSGDGTWTILTEDYLRTEKFDPFMLYLIGVLPPEKVPDAILISPPVDNKSRYCVENATIRGVAKKISIHDIINRYGKRIPSWQNSQKDFSASFVLLVRKGNKPSAGALEKLSRWSQNFPNVFKDAVSFSE